MALKEFEFGNKPTQKQCILRIVLNSSGDFRTTYKEENCSTTESAS